MRRLFLLTLCLLFALPVTPGLAKKKHKKKPINLGPVVTMTSTSPPVASTEEGTATATCPAGLSVVGGGFSSPLSAGVAVIVINSYMSSPTSWTVSGVNEGSTGAATATAYCRNTSRAPVTDVVSAVPATGVGSIATATPTCPGTSRLVGGGFQSARVSNDELFVKTNMSTSANTWTVSALNQDSSGTLNLTAHAYCISGISPPAFLNATTSTPAVQYTNLDGSTPTCPVAKPHKKKGKSKPKQKPKKRQAQLLSAGGFSIPVATLANPPQGIMGISQIGPGGVWSAQVTNATNGVGTLSLTVQGLCV